MQVNHWSLSNEHMFLIHTCTCKTYQVFPVSNQCLFHSISAKNKTPSRGAKTPKTGDRFIPNRAGTQFELGHYLVTAKPEPEEDVEMQSPSVVEYTKTMNGNLNGGDLGNAKIIAYKNKAPAAPEGACLSLCYTGFIRVMENLESH